MNIQQLRVAKKFGDMVTMAAGCLTFFSIVLFFSGCATPKKSSPRSPVTPPENWQATTCRSSMAQSGWLGSFHDGHLTSIVEEVTADNYDLKAAAARLDQAIAQSRIVAADMYPQAGGLLNGKGSTSTNTLSLSGYQYQLAPGNWTYAVTLNMSWEADVWGRLRGLTQAAKANATAAVFTYEGARFSFAGQAAKAWFSVLEAREQIRIAEATLESLRQTHELTKVRYENGAVSSFDVNLSSAEEITAESNLVQRKENFAETKRLLETLLGRYPAGAFDLDKASIPKLSNEVPAGLPSELLLRRPDLREADWTLFASENRVFSAKANRFPRFALTASGGSASMQLQNALNTEGLLVTIAANLAQPILDGGRINENIKLNQAQRDEAANNYAQQVLVAFREVENALSNETTLRTSQELQERALKELTAAYQIALDRYKAGQIDIVSFLQAQRSMLGQESLLVSTQLLRLNNRIDLYLALGENYGTKSPASHFRDSAPIAPIPKNT